jgi:hypothetical protein
MASAPTSLFTPQYTSQVAVSFARPQAPITLAQAPECYLFAQAPAELLNPTSLEPKSLNVPSARLLGPNDAVADGFHIAATPTNLSWDWSSRPIYVVSPANQVGYGQVEAPSAGQFYDEDALYAEVLDILARLARPEEDRKAGEIECGLYAGTSDFNPDCPGDPLQGVEAFVRLRQGLPVFFLPQFGDHEVIDDLSVLDSYVYKA